MKDEQQMLEERSGIYIRNINAINAVCHLVKGSYEVCLWLKKG